jgi:hypothetical protein
LQKPAVIPSPVEVLTHTNWLWARMIRPPAFTQRFAALMLIGPAW